MTATSGTTSVAAVIQPGPLSTLQDLGRFDSMRLGVPTAGALDQPSHRLANRLVGNAESCATIETTLGGLEIEFSTHAVAAVTGAAGDVFVDQRREGTGYTLLLRPGQRLRIDPPRAGLRSYLAVAGGFSAPLRYGSRSADLLSGLGPAPLAAGDRIGIDAPATAEPPWATVDVAPVAPPARDITCRVLPGPRRDWLVPEAWEVLTGSEYVVGGRSNRIGIRLEGPALERAISRELHSEGIVTGAIQVPGDGRPVVFMHDHPTTGGYPVIGVVHPADLHLLGQIVPGGTVRFRAC